MSLLNKNGQWWLSVTLISISILLLSTTIMWNATKKENRELQVQLKNLTSQRQINDILLSSREIYLKNFEKDKSDIYHGKIFFNGKDLSKELIDKKLASNKSRQKIKEEEWCQMWLLHGKLKLN